MKNPFKRGTKEREIWNADMEKKLAELEKQGKEEAIEYYNRELKEIKESARYYKKVEMPNSPPEWPLDWPKFTPEGEAYLKGWRSHEN